MRVCSRFLAGALLLGGLASISGAQSLTTGFRAATILPGPAVKLKPGETVEVPVTIQIRPAYHINSNKPADEYLIPTALTWESSGLDLKRIVYPEPELVSYPFSSQPISVFSNKIAIVSHFAVPDKVPALTELKGRLRYQACNSKACFPPTSADITVLVAAP